ncbi:MAG: SMC-Scp complex subunit ScpB [Propionibacteriaceae bacterium]|jgi:segregation and condensation protein B|nr:SMC-Scp complex subunit ScpB [Propionibacteriaceae bacterium]
MSEPVVSDDLGPGQPSETLGDERTMEQSACEPTTEQSACEADSSGWLDPRLEALLIVATEPVSATELAQVLELPLPEVEAGLIRLASFYDATGRGFELRRIGVGWRYYTRTQYDGVIARSVVEGQSGKLTRAGLETLAVIAYLQPVSRSRIASVRGVNVDSVVRTLVARGLVHEVDKDHDSGAGLLATTTYFLERMGLASLDELPPLAPNLPDARALDEELARLASAGVDGHDTLTDGDEGDS